MNDPGEAGVAAIPWALKSLIAPFCESMPWGTQRLSSFLTQPRFGSVLTVRRLAVNHRRPSR